eukprot:5459165-Prymnesium_polylepis.1
MGSSRPFWGCLRAAGLREALHGRPAASAHRLGRALRIRRPRRDCGRRPLQAADEPHDLRPRRPHRGGLPAAAAATLAARRAALEPRQLAVASLRLITPARR